MASLSELVDELARVRVARPAEIQAALRISAPTLSRLMAQAGDRVCRLGRARATKYARTRSVEGLGRRLPIFRVSETGEATSAGTLHLLWEGQHGWERPEGDLLFTGLPPALADMAPQGYLGQSFPACFPELGLPPRILDWSDDHRLVALARRGEDCVGDLVVGDESFARFLAWAPRDVGADAYPELAERSAVEAPGSSAGGERPKFGALSHGRHVLVKFAPPGGSPAARRWRDLLWCEWTALEILRAAGKPAARSAVLDVAGWRFLESERFDRVGVRGRRAVLTLGAIDDEHFGRRDGWTAAAVRLLPPPFSLPPEDAAALRWLDAFGQLVGNTDRHFGNVAVFVGAGGALRLAPAYDMLPMILAPAGETLVRRPYRPEPPSAGNLDVWPDAASWATRYLREVQGNGELEDDVRAFAGGAIEAIAGIAARVSPGG